MTRLARFQQKVKDRDLDGFIIMSPENRRYLSGFTGTAAVLLVMKEKAYLLTDFRYIEQAKTQAPLFEVVKTANDGFKVLKDLAGQAGKIGFEGDFVSYTDYSKLKELFQGTELVSDSSLITDMRSVKDQEEIDTIKEAVRVADEAFNHILKYLEIGQNEKEIALELEFAMRKLGADGKSFDFIVASGQRSALPHGVASAKRIERGELLTMDFGALYKGYCSDITRTVSLGQPDEKQREIYELVRKANQIGIEAVAPGKTGKEIDGIVRQFISDAGYGEYFGHGLGHSLGLAIHENPRLSQYEDRVLEPGMAVTVEPGIYLPGQFGVRIEDVVLVTEDGCKVLTQSPKEFIIIE